MRFEYKRKNSQKTSLPQTLIQFLHEPTRRHCPYPVERSRVATLGGRGDDFATVRIPHPKKNRAIALLLFEFLRRLKWDFPSAPRTLSSVLGGQQSAFYAGPLSRFLPEYSSVGFLSLPSAVGHSSVAASNFSKKIETGCQHFFVNIYIFFAFLSLQI